MACLLEANGWALFEVFWLNASGRCSSFSQMLYSMDGSYILNLLARISTCWVTFWILCGFPNSRVIVVAFSSVNYPTAKRHGAVRDPNHELVQNAQYINAHHFR